MDSLRRICDIYLDNDSCSFVRAPAKLQGLYFLEL